MPCRLIVGYEAHIILKTIENLTDADVPLAQQLRINLNDLYWKYHAQLPKSEGILLRPNSKSLLQYACSRKIR